MSTAIAERLGPALLLAGALALVSYNLFAARSFPQSFADLIGRATRRRAIIAWAAGTWATWGLTALIALILLDRSGTVVDMPDELIAAALQLDLPAGIRNEELAILGAALTVGMAIGIAILLGRRWLRKPPGWTAYQSPATARGPDEFPAAALLALSAGVSEELFFRLLLPMLVTMVTGSGVAGLAIGLIAFTALHRHQGWAGLILVALVGAGLTYLYLLTGQLWVAMLVHTLVDLNAFIVRPWIAGFRSSDASRS